MLGSKDEDRPLRRKNKHKDHFLKPLLGHIGSPLFDPVRLFPNRLSFCGSQNDIESLSLYRPLRRKNKHKDHFLKPLLGHRGSPLFDPVRLFPNRLSFCGSQNDIESLSLYRQLR